jgi:N-acetylmuramoyl-L-alanine amidase
VQLGALLLLLVLPALAAFARVSHNEAWAREKFSAAGRMREALNGRPAPERTRREYQRVIEAYRRVYYGSPISAKADASVVAVAELLAEMGRQFNDDKILHSAIGQYQFLRREYPGSRYRFDALFTIGEIYKDDLSDPTQARTTFTEFLHRYPRNRLADDAKAAIADLDQEAAEEAAKKEAAKKDKTARSTKDEDSEDSSDTAAAEQRNTYPRVTGVRHWSTPDYTRVAIDLEQDVKFDSQRIDNPVRIFFDLYGTKLASTLVGKSFDVEDGFLKKVRVAQFQPGRTRVVLEVDDLSEYNAFLLSNPSRLIIDIHGKKSAKVPGAQPESKPEQKQEVAKSVAPLVVADEEVPVAKAEKSPARSTTKGTKEHEGKPKTKPVAQTASASTSPQKKIVEADDDDDAADARPPAVQPLAKNSDGSGSGQSSGTDPHAQPGVRNHGKRKAADGNNDEVATLDPHDLRPEPKSPAAATTASDSSKATRGKWKRTKKSEPEVVAREARPTASGDRSLIRALGLKIGKIVIDPGHGGHDTGTIGPNGLEEKELVLDVAKRLGKLLQARMGADVVYTRQDDTFIPLETRTAIANQERADLFVSVHANSSHDPDARGVETYYLNFTSNADALEVAARENAVSDKSIHELQDLVKKIALKEKIDESREFATDVQRSLHSGLAVKSPGIRDRGVRKAPFIVLIGANMPSILAEISFVSNPTDERKLQTAEYRQRIAESLYKGISKYVGGLSGVKVASRMSKSDGQ